MKEFSYHDKLKSRKQIQALFSKGNSITVFPLKMMYLKYPDHRKIMAGVSVSKRKFKKAVDRNFIKRILRETYRLNKKIIVNESNQGHICMFLYIGKETPRFHQLNSKMERLLQEFLKRDHKI